VLTSVLYTVSIEKGGQFTIHVNKVDYWDWQNSYRLSNDCVELIETTDIRPHIIRFGFSGDENGFKEYPEQVGKIGGDEWRIYGGHRIWLALENTPRSYSPDNPPVDSKKHPGFVRLIQPVEASIGIQLKIDIALDPESTDVPVTYRLPNLNIFSMTLTPWAMSAKESGETAILLLLPRQPYA
jgi:hypothetical protein